MKNTKDLKDKNRDSNEKISKEKVNKDKDLKNKTNTNNSIEINVIDNQEEKESLAERLNNLENYLADQILSEDMKVIFAKIQMECADFRENVFFKNLNIIESETAKQKPNQTSASESDEEHNKKLLELKGFEEMLDFYTRKAEES